MKKLFILVISVLFCFSQKAIAQNRNIETEFVRNEDRTLEIRYTKELPGSYFVKIEFKNLENCFQSDYKTTVNQNSGTLIKLFPTDKNKHINLSYSISYIRGNPNAKVDENFNYVLPFKVGKKLKVIESSNLSEKYFDAEKDSEWKSFIVDRIEADSIYSMRKGIVVEIVDKYETDSLDIYKYTGKMNYVVIEHKDGTCARYKGLNKKSICVKLGQTVYPQTKLGRLEIFNNTIYRLYFNISFLKNVNFGESNNNSWKQWEHINPFFFSTSNPIKIKHNNEYLVEMDETTLFQELTKREKKKYKNSELNINQ